MSSSRGIDGTIAHLKGERRIKETELYSGIVSPDRQAGYEAWLVERYGSGMQEEIKRGRKGTGQAPPS